MCKASLNIPRCKVCKCDAIVLFCYITDGKSCFSIRKSISTSERRAVHPFAGGNTQHASD